VQSRTVNARRWRSDGSTSPTPCCLMKDTRLRPTHSWRCVRAYRPFSGAWLAVGRKGSVTSPVVSINRTTQWYAGYYNLYSTVLFVTSRTCFRISVDYIMAPYRLRCLFPVYMRRQFWPNWKDRKCIIGNSGLCPRASLLFAWRWNEGEWQPRDTSTTILGWKPRSFVIPHTLWKKKFRLLSL
jgi:hypothetical protein